MIQFGNKVIWRQRQQEIQLISAKFNQQEISSEKLMIKIGALKSRQKLVVQKIANIKFSRIHQQLSQHNFCFSDDNCFFQVNPNICVKDLFVAVQVRACPSVGLYSGIDFLVTIFVQDNLLKGPKIYNDRRIFHPNIDPYTLQISIPQAINWNPTNTLAYLLRRIKYTLIEPNTSVIPNNWVCKKAACLYRLDRQNYRNHVIQYCPAALSAIIEREIQANAMKGDQMEDQTVITKKYLNINEIVPLSRLKIADCSDEDDFDFLNKRLSSIRIQSDCRDEYENESKQNRLDNSISSETYGKTQTMETE